MAEKVLHEVRVVETEDGYRIEIKGDKERIKEFLQQRGLGGHGFGMGFGPMGGMGPMGFMLKRRHHHHGHGPWGHFARIWSGPWGWDEEEVEEDEAPRRGPAADRGTEDPRV